jgi:hypothetical protein
MSSDGIKFGSIPKSEKQKPFLYPAQQQESPKHSPAGSPKHSPPQSPKATSLAGAPPLPPWAQATPAMPKSVKEPPKKEISKSNGWDPPNPNDWQDEEEDVDMPPLEKNDKIMFEPDESSFLNGITLEEAHKTTLGLKQQLSQCTHCAKCYYKNGANSMVTFEYMESEPVCYHCIFWMNYGLTARQNVDGVYGKTIMEYIIQCKDFHDKKACTRNSNEGGCFLCDYSNRIPIENVLGSDVLADMMLNEDQAQILMQEEDDSANTHDIDFSFNISI